MSKNPLVDTLIAFSGRNEPIIIHGSFVRFTGSLEAAMMLNQMLYWTPKAQKKVIEGETGWVVRSDEEWTSELYISKYAVRQARAALEDLGILETCLKKWGKTPKLHYRLRLEALSKQWQAFLEKEEQTRLCEIEKSVDFAKSKSPGLCEIEKSSIRDYNRDNIETNISPSEKPPPTASQISLDLEIDPEDTVKPSAEADRLLFAALRDDARAKGRRGPRAFSSIEQKRVWRAATHDVAEQLVRQYIRSGLVAGCTARKSLVAWVVKCVQNSGGSGDNGHKGNRRAAMTKKEAEELFNQQAELLN